MFQKLQIMAKHGKLPKRLEKCEILVYISFLYAIIKRRPWIQRYRNNMEKAENPTRPWDVASVEQLRSLTPEFIAQMTGFLTTGRYQYTTVYVDQVWRISYVYQKKIASEE